MKKQILTHMIVNPISGKGRGQKLVKKICHELDSIGLEFLPHLTTYQGEAQKIASKAVKNHCELVIACGGDGTVNEVVNGLQNSQATLGIIPIGRGNDFARALNISRNITTACRTLKKGLKQSLYTIFLENRLFCSVAGLGLSANVNHLANLKKIHLPGPFTYILPLNQALKEFQFPKIKIEFDNDSYEGELSLLAIANTPYYGNGMKIAPTARANNKVMDVYLVEKASKVKLLFNMPSLFWGGHINKPYVKHFQATELRISSSIPLPIFADGEFFQYTPAHFKINPTPLNVIS